MAETHVQQRPEARLVATKAALRAAGLLNIKAKTLAAVLGVSEATVSRMHRGEYTLEPGTKPFELSVLFIRLFRSLDAIVSGDRSAASAWLRAPNSALAGIPLEQITTIAGLMDALAYLDARRAVL